MLAVELSSFQLHWSPSVRPAAGCVLNVAEDHLDWHGSMAAYAAAKARALRGPVAVAGVDDPAAAALLAARRRAAAGRASRSASPAPDQLGVVDGHAASTGRSAAGALVEAAAVTRPARPASPTRWPPPRWPARTASARPRSRAGLRDFRPGRAPRRRRRRGRRASRYVDDSKATNPHAARAPRCAAQARHARWCGSPAGCSRAPRSTTLVAAARRRLRAAVRDRHRRARVRRRTARDTRPMSPCVEVVPGDDDAHD